MRVPFGVIPLAALLLGPPLFAESAVLVPAATIDTSRLIVIDGGHNFRDAGGYRTASGRTVRRGVFYRSASMAGLTPQGMVQLQALRIGSIIDLRSTQERHSDTSNWLALSGQGYWTRDYSLDQTGFAQLFGDPAKLTAESVGAAMAQGYRGMPKALAPSYRELFLRLIAGRGATVVNCTAGKDRTGIGTALVLTALGVPYETVREDFLLSNRAIAAQFSRSPGAGGLDARSASAFAALSKEVTALLAGVDGPYLDAAFDQIRADYGSVDGYLAKELGLGPRELAQLRRRMLSR
jgi:protein-tyrosine phosphatase